MLRLGWLTVIVALLVGSVEPARAETGRAQAQQFKRKKPTAEPAVSAKKKKSPPKRTKKKPAKKVVKKKRAAPKEEPRRPMP